MLGNYYGTTEGEFLASLYNCERLIPLDKMEHQFLETMDVIKTTPATMNLARQVDRLRKTRYSQVTELEKRKLRQMLVERQARRAGRVH